MATTSFVTASACKSRLLPLRSLDYPQGFSAVENGTPSVRLDIYNEITPKHIWAVCSI